jgi:4-amino-4-deoxychorismate lyase
MYPHLETIRVVNRQFEHIEYHNERLNRTREYFLGIESDWDIRQMVTIPLDLETGVFKFRMVYDQVIRDYSCLLYTPKVVNKLRLVTCDEANYAFKSQDRSLFDTLYAQKGDADDVLIVQHNCLTDTTYSNVAFLDGNQWYTPKTYLLNGTCRQRLLQVGILKERRITTSDLPNFSACRPINSMLVFEATPFAEIVW